MQSPPNTPPSRSGCGCGAVLAVLFVWGLVELGREQIVGRERVVPDVVGSSVRDAREDLRARGFENVRAEPRQARGWWLVESQDPSGGDQARTKTTIELWARP